MITTPLRLALLLSLILALPSFTFAASGSQSSGPNCIPADCDDGNVCTIDGCKPDGSCFHLPRDGFVFGCSDRGSLTDCEEYKCNDKGQCVSEVRPQGESCTEIKLRPVGSGSCAGTEICITFGLCKSGTCVPPKGSSATCHSECGSGTPASEEADRTCCRTPNCSPFQGCGDICLRPEDQSTRCCTVESSGLREACGPGYTCRPECGCMPDGVPCPPGPSPSSTPGPVS